MSEHEESISNMTMNFYGNQQRKPNLKLILESRLFSSSTDSSLSVNF